MSVEILRHVFHRQYLYALLEVLKGADQLVTLILDGEPHAEVMRQLIMNLDFANMHTTLHGEERRDEAASASAGIGRNDREQVHRSRGFRSARANARGRRRILPKRLGSRTAAPAYGHTASTSARSAASVPAAIASRARARRANVQARLCTLTRREAVGSPVANR